MTVTVEVSAFVMFTVTCCSTCEALAADVITDKTDVVLVVVDVTVGRREEQSFPALVFDARQVKARYGDAWQAV